MRCVTRRVSDKAMLRLIKQWLVAPVEETDERGRMRRTTRNKHTKRGAPQGTPFTLVGESVLATFRAGLEDPRA
jgi:RNA-directed DNA polymerase